MTNVLGTLTWMILVGALLMAVLNMYLALNFILKAKKLPIFSHAQKIDNLFSKWYLNITWNIIKMGTVHRLNFWLGVCVDAFLE